MSYLAAREAPKSWLQENAICLKPRLRLSPSRWQHFAVYTV